MDPMLRGLTARLVLANMLLLLGGMIGEALLFSYFQSSVPRWALAALLVVIAAALSATVTIMLVQRPVRRIALLARSLAQGDLSIRADPVGVDELANLAHAINELRGRWAFDLRNLDRQRSLLVALLDQLHEGVVVARANGRIMLMNPAAVRLLHLAPPERGGPSAAGGAGDVLREERFLDQWVERCIPQHDLQQMLRARRAGGEDAVDERRLMLEAPGGPVHLLARAWDLVLPDVERSGAPSTAGRMLVLTDITEIGRALQMRTDFVANASHELRIPLSTIQSAIETLLQLDLTVEGEDARRFMQVIERQCSRLSALVGDLLDLARVEAQGPYFEPEPIRVRDLLEELREHFAEAVRAKELRWESACDDADRPTILASPQLLRLILDNLLENAIKFTDPGKTVRLRCAIVGPEAIFSVEDQGCGIDEAELERVFERFYQVERSRGGYRRGTGLGLSIVKHAINALGGQIALDSKVGVGTHVTVTVPVQPVESAALMPMS